MTESPEVATEQAPVQFPCQSCGANVEFLPGTVSLKCPYCGATQELEKEVQRPVVEYSFEEARRQARTIQARDLMASAIEVRCEGCGAHSVLQGQASRCPFCDSPVVVEQIDEKLFA